MISSDCLFETKAFDPAHYDGNGLPYICQPIPESVVIRDRLRRLIDRYINHDVGICLHFHSWEKSIDFEMGDLVFIFQKAIPTNPHESQRSSMRDANDGVSIGCPATDYVKLPMP